MPYVLMRTVGYGLERFDEGILLDATSFLANGVIPPGDAYQPYGPAYGITAVPGHWLFGPEAIVTRLSTVVADAIVPALVYAWLRPRAGIFASLGAAAIVALADVPRYALSWIGVLLFAIAVDAVVRRSAGGTLEAAARERPRAMAAATALLGLAAWIRLEYASLAVLWVLVVVVALRRRPPLALVVPPLAVAAVAHVAVLIAGGLQHYWWWGDYALFGFREFRSQPRNWDIPFDYLREVVHGREPGDLRLQMASYFAGAVMVATAAVSLALRRRGFIRRDPSLLAPFLVVAGAVVLYAQSVRFFGLNGMSAMPLLLPGFLALAFTWRHATWIRVGIVVVLAFVLWPKLDARWDARGQLEAARAGWRANAGFEPVERLRRMPLTAQERGSLPLLLDLWRRHRGEGDRVAVVNRRNEDAQANEAFVYWFLDARPAVWPVVYDPGLADAADVRAEMLDDLCRHRPPVVQFAGSYAKPWAEHRDRSLDPFIALNYRMVGESELYRMLVPQQGPCVHPEAVSLAELHARRDALLAAGDRPGASALAIEAVGRPGRADPEDAALAVLFQYRIDEADVPPGPAGEVVRAIQDGAPSSAIVPVATDRSQPPLVRLTALHAFIGGAAARPDAEKQQILAAAWELVRERPDIPDISLPLMSFQPPAEIVFARLARYGVSAPWLARWRFDTHVAAGDPRAIGEGRALLRTYARQPQERAGILQTMAKLFSATGDARCASSALAAADRIPGADPGPFERVPVDCPALGSAA